MGGDIGEMFPVGVHYTDLPVFFPVHLLLSK